MHNSVLPSGMLGCDRRPRRAPMQRRHVIRLIGGAVAAWPLAPQAQQPAKVPRIGVLGNSTAALESNLVGPFREGLRDLGYEEGRSIVIEYRWAEGVYE